MLVPFGDNIPSRRLPVVTCALIGVNLLALVWVSQLSPLDQQLVAIERGFIPARLGQLVHRRPLAVDVELLGRHPHLRLPVVVKREYRLGPNPRAIYASLVTALFLHGGWLHLLGNMWFLWIFGDNVEDRLGHFTFAAFYLGGGVLANLCHGWTDPHSAVPVIGASGAVAAVLGGYAITWPWARIRSLVLLVVFFTVVELPALMVLGFWFLTQLLEASHALELGMDGGVAWWAHVGGFLAGMAMMPLLDGKARGRRARIDRDEGGFA